MSSVPIARSRDPETSHAAARRARYFAPSHAEQIAGVMWRPMIPLEVSKLTGLSIVQIDRRLPEMQRDGQVELTGIEREGFREWRRIVTRDVTRDSRITNA